MDYAYMINLVNIFRAKSNNSNNNKTSNGLFSRTI